MEPVPAHSAQPADRIIVPREPRIRVLHVLKQMAGGGVESWLLHVARTIDRDKFHMDILVRSEDPSPFDADFEAAGVHVLRCIRGKRDYTIARAFHNLLQAYGPYDIIHCHQLFNRGYILRLARREGIRVRLAHSHNAPNDRPGAIRNFRRRFRAWWMSHWWTGGLACSAPAAREFYGPTWQKDKRFRVLYCGVDLEPFRQAVDPAAVRAELGIPPDAYIVGHVGRFEVQKNHAVLVDVAAKLAAEDPRIHFLLVGDGSLRPEVEAKIEALGLSDRFHLTGFRPDVQRLMLGAMDLFFLPSLWEGLCLVGMEAQAAGLPMVVSNAVTDEMDAAPELVRRVPLSSPAEEWARAILEMKAAGPALSRPEALRRLEAGPFNICNSTSALQAYYQDCLARAAKAR